MNEFRMILSPDVETYRRTMDEEVLPYLAQQRTAGSFETLPGQNLYYERYLADEPRGLVVYLHGFTEALPKHRENIWQFLQAGYHVWALQQREHGLSYRSTADKSLVHIEDYEQLARDVHGFLKKIVLKDEHADGLERIIYGHSMGGGVSTIVLECYPDDFHRAILSSPMLGMNAGGIPVTAAAAAGDVMLASGKGTSVMPGQQMFSDKPDFAGSLSGSEGRYMYWFNEQCANEAYQTSRCSWATARQFLSLTRHAVKPVNARLIHVPFLLLSAGADNTVDNKGQDKFMQRIQTDGRMVRYEGAKHELYMGSDELVEAYWKEIRAFLDQQQ